MKNNFHLNVKVLGKSGGRSAVQFSAYMSGIEATNERTLEHYNHTSKEEVIYGDMFFKDGQVPLDLQDQLRFWNAVEQNETAANAQFCRTWELAFPLTTTEEQNRAMLLQFKDALMEEGYCAVQVAYHNKDGNPHAHVMAPTRQMTLCEWDTAKSTKGYVVENALGDRLICSAKDIPEGYERRPILAEDGSQKVDSRGRLLWERAYSETNRLDSKDMLIEQRHIWERIQNQYLTPEYQVSCESYKTLGVDREPTHHLGYHAHKLELEGVRTEIGDLNRAIRVRNLDGDPNTLRTAIETTKLNIMELFQKLRDIAQEIQQALVPKPKPAGIDFSQDFDTYLKQATIRAHEAQELKPKVEQQHVRYRGPSL